MSHFAYACKMWYPLNLVLESWEYLWFCLTFCIVILDYGLKLHKLLSQFCHRTVRMCFGKLPKLWIKTPHYRLIGIWISAKWSK